MRHGSLFSGIGGFDLAAEWMGWENEFHCEWNEFGQRVLKYYWPKAKSYADITKKDFNIHRGRISVLTGGFPCQPYSAAGKRLGKEDDRHLWPDMLRAIQEIQPTWVVGENVRGLVNWNGGMVFDEVQSDLEAEGYEVQPFLIPACAVNAPHRRNRIFFVAYSSGKRSFQCLLDKRRKKEFRGFERFGSEYWKLINYGHKNYKVLEWEEKGFAPPVYNGDDGIPARLDGITFPKWRNESIKAGGNAIVPQVAYQIFKAIEQYENLNK